MSVKLESKVKATELKVRKRKTSHLVGYRISREAAEKVRRTAIKLNCTRSELVEKLIESLQEEK